MAVHTMIDLETGGLDPRCMILSIGIVKFNPVNEHIIDTLYLRPSLEEQEALGRVTDDGTIDWWSNQPPSNIEEAWGDKGRIPWAQAMEQVSKFFWGTEYVWSNGLDFDIPVINMAMRDAGFVTPWNYYNGRDTRTLFQIAGVKLSDDKHVTTHNALEDAIHQVKTVERAYKKLKQLGIDLI
jgi:exodeoxyribonuclease VIII